MSAPATAAERRAFDCAVLVRALKPGGALDQLMLGTPCGLVAVNKAQVRYMALPDVLDVCRAAAAAGGDVTLTVAYAAGAGPTTAVEVHNIAVEAGAPKSPAAAHSLSAR